MTSRQTAVAGFAFGPLLLAALICASTPDSDRSDAYWVRFFTDGSRQARLIVSGALLILAALAFVFFMAGLRDRAGAGALPAGFATMAAALMAVAGVLELIVPAVLADSASYVPDPNVLRILTEIGYAVLALAAMPAAALGLGLLMRAAQLPRPLVVSGLVICVLQLAALYYLPMILLALWSVAAAILLARRPLRIPRDVVAAPAP
jgi:hypothetical protein